MRFQDPIWPDLQQQRGGGFAEWEGEIGGAFFLRAGMRLDRLESEARKADAMIVPGPGYGKTTVRKAYQDVGRSTTADVRQEDHPVSANLRLSRAISENWKLHGSLGRTEAAPNLTQRYAAFGPVPGGYSVGTPSLRPEVSYEAEIRTEGRAGRHPLGAAVFARRIDDYLLPVTLTRMDVDGDGAPDRVRGTRNEDAEMWGMEVSGIWVLHEQVQVSASLDWVRGRSRSENRDLPEIPPLEFKGGLHWRSAQVTAPAVELGWRVVSKQDKIDPEFGEDATPSFALLHLRAGYAPRPGWRVEVGLENLLNREYHEHLSREALLPTGDLQAGDEVPGPGRSLQVSLRKDW
jgi:iron complex outermembrane receptor protein